MDRSCLESILSKTQNPGRVVIAPQKEFFMIMSAENTNDTIGWFTINSRLVEELVKKVGAKWYYLFETAAKQSPCIYMFIGEGLSKDFLEDYLQEGIASCQENRQFFLDDKPFSTIDIDQYDNSISALEDELIRKSSDVLKVYEP